MKKITIFLLTLLFLSSCNNIESNIKGNEIGDQSNPETNSFISDKQSIELAVVNPSNLIRHIADVDINTLERIGYDYWKDSDNIYFLDNDILIKEKENTKILNNIDKDTFKVWNYNYSQDKYHIYYKGNAITGIDLNSFKLLGCELAKDKNNFFYKGKISKNIENLYSGSQYLGCGYYIKDNNFFSKSYNTRITGVDLESFEVIDRKISIDNNYIYTYIENNKLIKIKRDGFENIEFGYFKNKDSVYNKGEIIEGSDINTFEILSRMYSKDINNVYYNGKKIDGINPNGFTIISSEYAKNNENVFYINNGKLSILEGADSNTFKLIGINFGKDNRNVYYLNVIIENADPESFRLADVYDHYGLDKNNVYENAKIIEGINPRQFEILNRMYFKSIESIFCYPTSKLNIIQLSGADHNSFEIFKVADKSPFDYFRYGKDKNNVYYDCQIIKDSDPSSFSLLEHGYGKDKNNVYYYGKIITGFEGNGFELINESLAKSNNFVYNLLGQKIFQGAHATSFKKLSKDGKIFFDNNGTYYFYYDSYIYIKGADPDTIEKISESKYYKDKNNVYVYDFYDGISILTGANPDSFEYLKGRYSRDNNFVYYYTNKITGAIPETFEVLDGTLQYSYAKDKKSVYIHNYLIKEADPTTFKILKNVNYSKDYNNVYYLTGKIEGADPITFQILEKGEAKDKNHKYKDGEIVE